MSEGDSQDSQKKSCNKCADMYAVIEVLKEKHEVACAQVNVSAAQQEDLDQFEQDIIEIESDLNEYRSHVARPVYI